MKLRTLLALSLLASGTTTAVHASEDLPKTKSFAQALRTGLPVQPQEALEEEQSALTSLAEEMEAAETEFQKVTSEKADSVELKVLSKEEAKIEKYKKELEKLKAGALKQKDVIAAAQAAIEDAKLTREESWKEKLHKNEILQAALIAWKKAYSKYPKTSLRDGFPRLENKYKDAAANIRATQEKCLEAQKAVIDSKIALTGRLEGLQDYKKQIEKTGTEANKYIDELNTPVSSILSYLSLGLYQDEKPAQRSHIYNPEILKELGLESAQ